MISALFSFRLNLLYHSVPERTSVLFLFFSFCGLFLWQFIPPLVEDGGFLAYFVLKMLPLLFPAQQFHYDTSPRQISRRDRTHIQDLELRFLIQKGLLFPGKHTGHAVDINAAQVIQRIPGSVDLDDRVGAA